MEFATADNVVHCLYNKMSVVPTDDNQCHVLIWRTVH